MLSWQCGPFRTSVEALDARSSNDIQLSSAVGLIKLEWAYRVHTEFDLIHEEDDDYKLMEKAFGCLAFRLRMMVTDRRWLSTEYSFDNVSTTAGRLAYTLTLLDSDFAKCLSRVLRILLYSMASDQATVRSKSLKSINHLFETDPTIIDREPTVVPLIQERLNDPSVQVRESALNLIAKIISSRQALENENISLILARTRDSGVGVRKRAMKLAKEIYLRNQDQSVRSAVAEALMHRVDEPDEGVRDLARQTMEEIWMSPFYESTAANDHSPQFKLAIADHVALMVKTVQGLQPNGHQPSNVLDKVLQNMLSENSKSAQANLRVCKVLVAAMFETIIDNSSEDSGASSAIDALRILETFAKSNAKMFTVEQMQLLQPYTKNLRTSEQLAIFRPVVNIYRHVLPHLSRIHDDFLQSVRADLIPLINKVTTTLVDDVVACVSIICKTLEDFSRLNQVLSQVLKRILTYKNTDLKPEEILYLTKLLPIAGYCAKNCDFEPQRQLLATHFPKLKNDSVPKLVTDTLAPFASPVCPITVRKPALEGIGMVCQSWPKNFSFVNVFTSFEQVFDEKIPALERIVMKAFQNFLFIEEKRSEAEKEALPGASADPKAKLGVMGGSHGDGIALGIAQRFLSKIITVALSSKNDGDTLLATEVIASIAHQGLVHPKLPGIALIALETSQNPKIAEIAFREHQKLHEKHETLFERDYMTAVHGAYDYQRDVVQDTRGAISKSQGYTAKLSSMVEVLKISKVKTRKKFYDNLCSQLDVSKPRKDGNDKQMPARNVADHLAFSQFIAENMAFFDYPTVDELLSAITAMEKRVFLVGTEIAHSIETEIFHIRLDAPTQTDENGQLQPPENAINVSRLKELTVSTMTLSLLGEARTYLKRQYGLKTSRQDGKSKTATKDSNRAPVRLPGVNGDKFWAQVTTIMSALESEETMMNQCRSFVELLTHDPDFKVAAEGDEDRPVTPDDDDGERGGTPGPPGSGRGRKRKASITPLTPGGKKKRGRAKGAGKRASMEGSDDDDDY